jgi:hypothetical protein
LEFAAEVGFAASALVVAILVAILAITARWWARWLWAAVNWLARIAVVLGIAAAIAPGNK